MARISAPTTIVRATDQPPAAAGGGPRGGSYRLSNCAECAGAIVEKLLIGRLERDLPHVRFGSLADITHYEGRAASPTPTVRAVSQKCRQSAGAFA